MTKMQFLMSLHDQLLGLPKEDVEQRLNFYSEMIEDRMEEGMTEAEAVAAIGSPEEIVSQIIADTPLVKIAKERIKPKRRLKSGEIVLLALGSPLWLLLLLAAGAVILAVYASTWSVIFSLWAAFGSLAACALAGVVAGAGFMIGGHSASGIALIGAGLICAGLSILFFLSCKAATKGTVILTGKLLRRCFHRKENIHG